MLIIFKLSIFVVLQTYYTHPLQILTKSDNGFEYNCFEAQQIILLRGGGGIRSEPISLCHRLIE